jgi:ectoine hydroxylase-related dioxygenase (phytanoyl-CoA dioxygenase family)
MNMTSSTFLADVEILEEHGYLFKESLISVQDCDDIISYLDKKESPVKIPFSDVPWGYGNLIGDEQLKCVYDNPYIRELCKEKLGNDFVFNHLMINNKAPWIGPSVEWHQEMFNIDTYAPGAASWENFLQIYIALHPHMLENGCLKIIPSSHKLGLLPHEDFVNENFGHKRRIPSQVMDNIYGTCGIKNVVMEQGDALFFNHRLVHGSSSNTSPLQRKAIVLQARLPFDRNDDLFVEETLYRRNFVLKALENKVGQINEKNMYEDFNRKK